MICLVLVYLKSTVSINFPESAFNMLQNLLAYMAIFNISACWGNLVNFIFQIETG